MTSTTPTSRGALPAATWRGAADYEEVRAACVWNARKPARYPHVIVCPSGPDDAVAAVRYANEHDIKVSVCSGGHSWSATGVRDGGVLINMGALADINPPDDHGIVAAGPGVKAKQLYDTLASQGRFFPTGHCPSVGIGGFLLAGGWGWRSRALGPACQSVEAIDVVTAAGDVIRADATQNTDFLWAARGAGPGMFGIVSRYYLRTYPSPSAVAASTYRYPFSCAASVLRWLFDIVAPELSADIELTAVFTRNAGAAADSGDITLTVSAVALTRSLDSATTSLSLLDTCPAAAAAEVVQCAQPTTFDSLYAAADALEPEGLRWAADSMWTDADADDLISGIMAAAERLPSSASHVIVYPWRVQDLGWGALSLAGRFYVLAIAGWDDPSLDTTCTDWATSAMRSMEAFAKGVLLSTENLARRPARFLSAEHAQKLGLLRGRHDPQGRFNSYLTSMR